MIWLTARAVELWQWLLALEAPFAFLLALPFMVALAAFLGEGVRTLWSVHARKS
jgi:hypothetical protein